MRRYLRRAGDTVTRAELLEHALGLEVAQWTRPVETRVGCIMTRLRWAKRRTLVDGERAYVYERPTSTSNLVER